MASKKSTRRSRKRRHPDRPPRAVASSRREARRERQAEQRVVGERQAKAARRQLGTVGERPSSPFGGVPVSELAILAGMIALAVWFFGGYGIATLIAGLVVITLGVLEVTAREHFSGYRSHTTLLAAIPAVAAGIAIVSQIGTRQDRLPVLIVVAGPIFALLAWLLRKRFRIARQARVARPPVP